MTDFNTTLTINEIIRAYTTNVFPNASCLLWNHEQDVELLITQFSDVIETENSEGVSTDGGTRFYL